MPGFVVTVWAPREPFGLRVHPVALTRYLVFFGVNLVSASLHVSWAVLQPHPHLREAFIAAPIASSTRGVVAAIAAFLLVSGATLSLLGAIGIHRFDDVFARMHAATKPVTLGLLLHSWVAGSEESPSSPRPRPSDKAIAGFVRARRSGSSTDMSCHSYHRRHRHHLHGPEDRSAPMQMGDPAGWSCGQWTSR